ncbi:MAG TPA: hypothetical protein VNH65_03250 [Candidatus Acidoferrum sp.]|nr:hypothetical protein [Candidatus Acidoferrum sp.]
MRKDSEIVLSTTTDTQAQAEFALGLRQGKPAGSTVYGVEQEIIRAEEQEETRLEAELHFLDHTSYPEYRKRREEMRTQEVEPNLPLDEKTYRDYCIARDKETGGRR